jgi:RNA polymerase sigma factor for flagellar operon FliA
MEDDLTALWQQFKSTGDPALQERLVEHYLPLVRNLAMGILRKLRPGSDLDDLVADGMFGLLRAIEGFDLARGFKFETYATPVVRGAIFNGLRRLDWLPERTRGKQRALQKAIDKLSILTGRQPTEEDLALELKMSTEEVYDLITSLGTVYFLSLDQPLTAGDESDATVMDLVEDSHLYEPSTEVEFEEERQRLRQAIERLNEREQMLIKMHYFEGVTFEKISRLLGVSKQRVSQMHSRAVRRLREALGEEEIDPAAMQGFLLEPQGSVVEAEG